MDDPKAKVTADVIVDSPLISLWTAFRFDPNTDPLSTFQQMGP